MSSKARPAAHAVEIRRTPLMSTTQTSEAPGARTGEQFLEGLSRGGREIWLRGEKIADPLEHAELRGAALSLARVFDAQHQHPDELLAPSPDDPDRLVNITHLIPRTGSDLVRRRRAFELVASLSGGTMGRTPDYLNVTMACFAGRCDVWARRGNEQGAESLVAYQAYMRDHDLSTTHALMNPQVDRTKPEAEQAMGQVALHKVADTEHGTGATRSRSRCRSQPPACASSAATASPNNEIHSTTRCPRGSTRWTRS
jgi:aromatic ring hydroxylase